jgi:hypothetical protein
MDAPSTTILLYQAFHCLIEQLVADLHDAVYRDIRSPNRRVVEHLPAKGAQVERVAWAAWMTQQSMKELVEYLAGLRRIDAPWEGSPRRGPDAGDVVSAERRARALRDAGTLRAFPMARMRRLEEIREVNLLATRLEAHPGGYFRLAGPILKRVFGAISMPFTRPSRLCSTI